MDRPYPWTIVHLDAGRPPSYIRAAAEAIQFIGRDRNQIHRMMDQVFDPLNLLILAVAVVVFLRLRSVLGKRTGNERPPFDPYAGRRAEARPPPRKPAMSSPFRRQSVRRARTILPEPPAEPVWKGFAEAGSPLAAGLEELAAADKQFKVAAFLEGAKVAYEMIILAFGQGDRNALKDLVSKDVFDSFSAGDRTARQGRRDARAKVCFHRPGRYSRRRNARPQGEHHRALRERIDLDNSQQSG